MVEPEELRQAQVRPEAFDPPVEAVPLEDVPAVERVAPQLPRRAEVVGRNPRDADGVARLVQLEDLGVRPDVGAVGGDVDRDVAEDPDPPLVGCLLDAVPLAEEEELEKDVPGDVVGQLALDVCEGRRLPAAQLFGPLPEGRSAVSPFQCHEESPVLQPVLPGRRFAEPLELGPQLSGSVASEAPPRLAQETILPRDHLLEVDLVLRETRHVLEQRAREKSVGDEELWGQEHRIAGEGRKRAVGGVPVARRPERQDLPDGLPGGLRPVEEDVALRPEVADAVAAREGRRVEEDAGGTGSHSDNPTGAA